MFSMFTIKNDWFSNHRSESSAKRRRINIPKEVYQATKTRKCLIINCRSLCSRDIRRFIGIELEILNPFDDLKKPTDFPRFYYLSQGRPHAHML